MNEWILVVDDDSNNLKAAGHILVKSGMRASCVRSGADALKFLDGGQRRPDLILLDIHMPGMDGYETLQRIRGDAATATIPTVFLTADDDAEAETRGLEAGAMDFIRKPFVPEVLLTRVRHIIELTRLQNDLESQVREKTEAVIRQQEKLNRLSIQIVMTLSGAVDAKDKYTNGHSKHVAEYSREIARRYGYDEERAQNIYMIGLLHDIGKIGIPPEVLNKPGRLTDKEYGVIKSHTTLGYETLKDISIMPELSIGASAHHERPDGKGYPNGLKGDEIPRVAQIIAVADTFDAMYSNRPYRSRMNFEKVVSIIRDCAGTQLTADVVDAFLRLVDKGEFRAPDDKGEGTTDNIDNTKATAGA